MALVDLAATSSGRPVSLADIAERQEISLSYLEQLFAKLRRGELVNSVRGPGGGYSLARAPEEIAIAQIMTAVDEPVKMTRCEGESDLGCIGDHRCLTHDLWDALGDHILAFLGGVTLADVVDNAAAKEAALGLAGAGKARERRQAMAGGR